MLMIGRSKALPSARSRGKAWLQTALLAVVGITLAVVGFFFVAVALLAGVCLALVIAVRWWWLVRRLRAARKAAGPLEGEYVVLDKQVSDQRPR